MMSGAVILSIFSLAAGASLFFSFYSIHHHRPVLLLEPSVLARKSREIPRNRSKST
jgi:hypothetical protein